MQLKQISAAVPDGVYYSAGEEEDAFYWSSRKLPGGRNALIGAFGVLLLWMAFASWITAWVVSGGLPWPVGCASVLAAWSGLLIPLHFVLKVCGREGVRVSNDDVEFTFAGLFRPRKIIVPRNDLRGLTLVDREKFRGDHHRWLQSNFDRFSSRRPSTLLLAEGLGHEEKTQLHVLLCNVLARRGWVIET